MFPKNLSIQDLNRMTKDNLLGHLGIEMTEASEHYLVAKMPVDERTKQPMGLLHGGASVALAESLGSVASSLLVRAGQAPVGLEINANHIKSAKEGYVYGTVKAIHVGRKTHVWDIQISNEFGDLVCVSRLTVAIIDQR